MKMLGRGYLCIQIPKDTPAAGPTTQTVAANLLAGGHCSYVYLGSGFDVKTVANKAVVACEPPSLNGGAGMNVLLGDGSVIWLDAKGIAQFKAKLSGGGFPVTMPVN